MNNSIELALKIFVEKTEPNYKRDGIFIVTLLIIVVVLEFTSGSNNAVTMHTIPKEKEQIPAPKALVLSLIHI